jgi:ATP-binding cassette subfamily B (MDR/TAP) protein 1
VRIQAKITCSRLTILIRQIRELQLAASQPLGMLLYQFISIIASVGTAIYFSWKLALVILATVPLTVMALAAFSRGVGDAIEGQKQELSKASKCVNTAITSIDTVKVYNGQEQEVWRYASTVGGASNYYLIQAKSNALQFGIVKFAMVGLFVVGFWYGLYLLTKGLNSGNIATTFFSCLAAVQAIEVVLPQLLVISKGISAGGNLKTIMSDIESGRNTRNMTGGCQPQTCSGDIEVNDVSDLLMMKHLS